MNRYVLFAGLFVLAIGCGRSSSGQHDRASAVSSSAGDEIVRTNTAGPLRAKTALSPKKPRVGDRLVLTLTVEAKKGVAVEMPAFGEALGRFSIVSFVPREEPQADGRTLYTQRYELEPPMTGRNRIPSLRIQFSSPGGPDDKDGAEPGELLTDALSVDVASAAGDAPAELGALRDALSERQGLSPAERALLALGLLGIGALAWVLWRKRKAAAAVRVRLSAFDVALGKLTALAERGLPDGDAEAVDAFYVELSAIVRRYVEDRFAIAAPELTTEEFLREASRSHELLAEPRELLAAFLVECDRVKFAAHRPNRDTSLRTMATARSFLEQTKLVATAEASTTAASSRDAQLRQGSQGSDEPPGAQVS